jgi:hypothetical protein
MALQGHDHAYLRSHPLKASQPVASPKEGTVRGISVSGTKMSSQGMPDYTGFGMTNVVTYQVLDIQISGNRLVYRAYDIDGKLRAELVIEVIRGKWGLCFAESRLVISCLQRIIKRRRAPSIAPGRPCLC